MQLVRFFQSLKSMECHWLLLGRWERQHIQWRQRLQQALYQLRMKRRNETFITSVCTDSNVRRRGNTTWRRGPEHLPDTSAKRVMFLLRLVHHSKFFNTRTATAVLFSVVSVCVSVCQRDNSWTVTDLSSRNFQIIISWSKGRTSSKMAI